MGQEEIILSVDEKPVIEAVRRANVELEGFETKTLQVVKSAQTSFRSLGDQIAQHARQIRDSHNQMGSSIEGFARQILNAAKTMAEYSSVIGGATLAMGKLAIAHRNALDIFEMVINRARAAKLAFAGFTEGLGGAAIVGAEIAVVVAAEKLLSNAYQRAAEIQRLSAVSVKYATPEYGAQAATQWPTDAFGRPLVRISSSGTIPSGFAAGGYRPSAPPSILDQGFQTATALGFASQRAGVSSDYFNEATKAAGGVDKLAQKLRELDQIQDPIERVQKTFLTFGENVGEKMLPMLGTRFGENTQRVKEWGLTLDQTQRQELDSFKRGVDSIGGAFESLGDKIAAAGRRLKDVLAVQTVEFLKANANAIAAATGGRAWFDMSQDASGRGGGLPLTMNRLAQALGVPQAAANRMFGADKSLLTNTPELLAGAAAPVQYSQAAAVRMLMGPGVDSNGQLVPSALGARASEKYMDYYRATNKGRLEGEVEAIRGRMFVSDVTSPKFGQLVQAAQYPGGDMARAQDAQRYLSDQQQLEAIDAQKDADKEAKKAAEEASALSKRVQNMARSVLGRAQDFGQDPLTSLLNDRKRALGEISGASLGDVNALKGAYALLLQKTIPGAQQTSLADISNPLIAGAKNFANFDAKRGQQQFEQQYQASKSAVEADRAIAGINLGSDRSVIEMSAARAQKVAGLTSNDPRQAAQSAYGIQLQLANQLYDADLKRSQLESDADKRRVDQAHAYADLEKSTGEARINYEISILEIRKSQEEGVAHTASGLFTTLFTKAQNFGRQLGSTIRSATLKPVTEGLGNMVSKFITPMVYGADGTGGINGALRGMFGGAGKDPVSASTDGNTLATQANTAVMYTMSAMMAAGMGVAAPSAPAGTGAFGISVPSITASAPLRSFLGGAGFSGFSGPGWSSSGGFPALGPAYAALASGGGWSGGDTGFSGSGYSGGGGFVGGGGGGGSALSILGPAYRAFAMSGGFGGGGGAAGTSGTGGLTSGLSGALRTARGGLTALGGAINYKGDGQWNTSRWTGGNSEGQGVSGAAEGIATSAVTGQAGMQLAQAGILGERRGTWGGVGESTAGGAMIGLQQGGPIGAAIGATIGFGIGIGEMIAGVLSPEQKAIRDVKNMYHIDISMQMAKQIAQIAQQKYAGNVNMAVSSPQVRDMLGLYAAGTGQKFPASASTPHAASLIEQGGQLYQGASYQYGNAYAFQSNLPVMGANNPTILPSPGGSSGQMMMQVNIDGKGSGDYMAGNVFTADYVQNRFSDALSSSNGRVDNSATLSAPGLIVS